MKAATDGWDEDLEVTDTLTRHESAAELQAIASPACLLCHLEVLEEEDD